MAHFSGQNFIGDRADIQVEIFLNSTHPHPQVADAIKSADPKALVTVGAWSERTITDEGSDGVSRNYYSDECLVKAGGLADGTIDFVQVHSYAHGGSYGYDTKR